MCPVGAGPAPRRWAGRPRRFDTRHATRDGGMESESRGRAPRRGPGAPLSAETRQPRAAERVSQEPARVATLRQRRRRRRRRRGSPERVLCAPPSGGSQVTASVAAACRSRGDVVAVLGGHACAVLHRRQGEGKLGVPLDQRRDRDPIRVRSDVARADGRGFQLACHACIGGARQRAPRAGPSPAEEDSSDASAEAAIGRRSCAAGRRAVGKMAGDWLRAGLGTAGVRRG